MAPPATSTHIATPTVEGRRAEAPLTLEEESPRVLSLFDQLGLWGNLGVSLLGPVGAIYVLQPAVGAPLSLLAAFVAVVVGTVLGTALLAVATIPGAQTGRPSMVLLRGLFGRTVSAIPTVLNVVALVGWSVFEIVVISEAAQQLLPWHELRWPYVLVAGVLTTVMAVRPLGSIRVLRKYAVAAVLVATVYLFVQLLRNPLPPLNDGTWTGFWAGADVAVAVAVSWVSLASDYSRHSRSVRAAVAGSFIGYTITQIAYYTLGLIALVTVVQAGDALQHDMFATFIALPLGWLAFGVLALRELDQSFADTYSTVMSLQNLAPRLDRRRLAIVLGVLTTTLALLVDTGTAYQNFLLLLGSVFVPMFAVFIADYFLAGGHREWDTSANAPSRWVMLAPWAAGFVTYQLINPGSVPGWTDAWQHIAEWVHFPYQTWMSASVLSFVVALVLTLPVAKYSRRDELLRR